MKRTSMKTLFLMKTLLDLVVQNERWNPTMTWYLSRMPVKMTHAGLIYYFKKLSNIGCVTVSSKHAYNHEQKRIITAWSCKFVKLMPAETLKKLSYFSFSIDNNRVIVLPNSNDVRNIQESAALGRATAFRYKKNLTQPLTKKVESSNLGPRTMSFADFAIELPPEADF